MARDVRFTSYVLSPPDVYLVSGSMWAWRVRGGILPPYPILPAEDVDFGDIRERIKWGIAKIYKQGGPCSDASPDSIRKKGDLSIKGRVATYFAPPP